MLFRRYQICKPTKNERVGVIFDMSESITPIRCHWCSEDPLYIQYHDTEWGVPVFNDSKLFEFLILEGAQAGLSWITILRKRENYRKAFDEFSWEKIAAYDEAKVAELLQDPGIIRNRLKIAAAIQNAQAFMKVIDHHGSFASYIWQFVEGAPIHNNWQNSGEVPAQSKESERMSKDLRKWGFRFVGPTICYAFMQAVGMVNDHTTDCFRHSQMKTSVKNKIAATVQKPIII